MAKDKNVTGEEILDICSAYMSADDLKLVEKAWHYATDAHSGQSRQSGEPYIIHPIQVAGILADLHLDAVTVACGFLHDVVEDTEKTLDDLEADFGTDVRNIVDGVTKLIMMKSDVLDTFETIKACVAYKVNGEEIDYFPFDIEGVEPVYVELPGWQTDMTKMQSEDEFPEEFNAYLSFLEEQLGVPVKIVSVGPDRGQTIERYTEE